MKYQTLFSLVFAFVISGTTAAQAGILIEPYGGYASGTISNTQKASPFTAGEGTVAGSVVGGRLGYSFLGLWVAGDYMSLAPNLAITKPSATAGLTSTSRYAFVDVGFDFPFLLRVWGGYGVSNYLRLTYADATGSYEDIATGGTAAKFGVGLSFLMFCSLNVEYINPSFKTISNNKNGSSVFSGDVDARYSNYNAPFTVVTLSFPFNLL